MFSKFKLGSAAFLLCVSICNVHAQELTMEDCVQQALQHNPAIVYAKQSEQIATEDVSTTKAKNYPDVRLETGYRRFFTHAFLPEGIGGDIPDVVGPINDYRMNVQTNYIVYDGGQRSSDTKTAKAQLAGATQETNRTRVDIVYRTQTAFYEVLEAQDAVQLAKTRETRSKDHLKLAEERKAVGAVPQFDVTRSRTDVASAQLEIASAESDLRLALGRLNEVMGRSASEPLQIAKPMLVAPDPAQIKIDESMKKAMETRPEILAAQQRVQAKHDQIGSVHSEIMPKLKAEAGYGFRDNDFDPPDKDWWVGVTLNIPLWDGGVRSHKIAKSKIDANRESQQLEQTKLSVQQEVWSAYSLWIEAFQALQTSGVMKSEASESLGLVNARYEEGAGTINDLLDAELSLNQSETQMNNARYRVHMAYAAFLRSSGQL
jgi:outer membrane protein